MIYNFLILFCISQLMTHDINLKKILKIIINKLRYPVGEQK